MFLLICAIEKELLKYELTGLIQENPLIESAIWLNGENAKEVEASDMPFTIGSMASLFKNKKQDVLLAKIRGSENLDKVIDMMKNYNGNVKKLDYFVIPIVA